MSSKCAVGQTKSFSSTLNPLLSLVALALLAAATQPAASKDRPWERYESAYFVANSNAGHKKTLEILTNLELFRVAVYQAANLRVPETAPKTDVLIVQNRKEFREIEPSRGSGGFTTRHDGRFLIVMPASSSISRSTQVIRHEYVHVLLGITNIPFPQWYNEGFAELASTIKFRDRNAAFTFGEPPPHIYYSARDKFDWNTLISKGWDNRSIHQGKAFRAYMQSWLLVHYVMLGENFTNTPKLRRYLELIKGGQASLPAFEEAFGMDGNEMWIRKLRRHDQNLFALVLDFRADDLKTDFQRTDSDYEAVHLLLEHLRNRHTTK